MRAAKTRKPARSHKSATKAKSKTTKAKRTTRQYGKEYAGKAPRAPKASKAKARWADENGPLDWLLPTLESGNAPLAARDAAAAPIAGMAMAVSSFQPTTSSMLAATQRTAWRDVLLEYKQRKAARLAPTVTVLAPGAAAAKPPAAFVPGARNWQPLGPTIVLNGQTVGNQPVGGRVSRLAVAPGAAVVYAASANGGVFRSNDGGTSWRSLMDRFDVNPTSFASTSLVCGAIAINANDPNRVYVGTGEGDTLQLFRRRVTSALPAYRGVGVIRSDDGGDNWVSEPSIPDLSGEAFFDLAVDPGDGDNVIGATTIGLFHRVAAPGGGFSVEAGAHGRACERGRRGPLPVLRRDSFAAEWGQKTAPSGVFHSDDGGATWSPTGTGFPTNDVGRIALACSRTSRISSTRSSRPGGVAWRMGSTGSTVSPRPGKRSRACPTCCLPTTTETVRATTTLPSRSIPLTRTSSISAAAMPTSVLFRLRSGAARSRRRALPSR